MKQIINAFNAPVTLGLYAQANMANGVLYIYRQISVDPATGKLVERIEKITLKIMKNLAAILTKASIMTFKNIVKATICHMDDLVAMNYIYTSYLNSKSYTACHTGLVSYFPKNVDIEISMIVAHQN